MTSRINPATFGYQNFYSGTLTADITSGSLTIAVDTVPVPTSGILVIDPDSDTNREVVYYTSKGVSTVICPSDGRGFSGTTPVSHLNGTSIIMAPVDRWFSGLASGELSTDPVRTDGIFKDYVVSGCVWSLDNQAISLNASMTSGFVYISGRKYTVDAVSAVAMTANKDTYIDLTPGANNDGKATLVYTTATNNAASPALAGGNMRIAIIISTSGALDSNQGQENKLVPMASSISYTVTDSLGNLICPRDPSCKTRAYRQITSNATTTATSATAVTGLSAFVSNITPGRKLKVTAFGRGLYSSTNNALAHVTIWNGTVGSGALLGEGYGFQNGGNGSSPANATAVFTPSTTTLTINIGLHVSAGTGTLEATSGGSPAGFIVEDA